MTVGRSIGAEKFLGLGAREWLSLFFGRCQRSFAGRKTQPSHTPRIGKKTIQKSHTPDRVRLTNDSSEVWLKSKKKTTAAPPCSVPPAA